MATKTLSAPTKDGQNSGNAQKAMKYVPPHKRRKEEPQTLEIKQWMVEGMTSLDTAASANDAKTPRNVQEAKTYRPPRRRSETEPDTWVIEQWMGEWMKNLDTAVLPAPTDVVARDSHWDDPDDERGVIMYLPPKRKISGDLLASIEDIEDGVFGHPVVIIFASRIGDIETVYIFPITSNGGQGPYKEGEPGVPRHPKVMPIPLCPERQVTDLTLDLESDRPSLDTASGVNTTQIYEIPYQILDYWHGAVDFSTSPRLKKRSYDKMMEFSKIIQESATKYYHIQHNNWRSNTEYLEMDPLTTENPIKLIRELEAKFDDFKRRWQSKLFPERGAKYEVSTDLRRKETVPQRAAKHMLLNKWRQGDPSAQRPSTPINTRTPSTLNTQNTPRIPTAKKSSTSSTETTPTTSRTLSVSEDDPSKPMDGPSSKSQTKTSQAKNEDTLCKIQDSASRDDFGSVVVIMSDVEEGLESGLIGDFFATPSSTPRWVF